MKRIIRHVISVDDRVHIIPVPVGSNAILHIASRRMNEVDIWVMDDPSKKIREAHFRVVGTGHEIDDNEYWVGTCVVPGGALVWHLVERWVEVS